MSGSFDILWLDGGWITGEDIHLDRILSKARKKHPGLISVDRSIRGKNENYQTPERGIPIVIYRSCTGGINGFSVYFQPLAYFM